jgi:ABC-type hemin transport system substrate-binding protein
MTGTPKDSLGQAIKDLAPTVDAKSAAKTAENQARADLKATEKPNTLTVAQRIDAHPDLVTRLTPLLPSGMTLDQAAAGFKTQGQFIAALHVSKDLNIPFDKLKADMTGGDSLGQAIKDLAPTANVKAAVGQAEKEARADLKATEIKADADDKGKDDK